ncbi:MAG: Nif3-like dinuclear metal center hexameric protein [Ruminococcus sp.]|nr:Nif3-like dinuclear metal center hexameric protein [Ruminococcus sp.]
MTKIKDIIEYTETFAPLADAADFDNCGLLVGDPSQQVTRVLVSLDITPQVVKEAQEISAELILSHHPVIFSPLRSLSTDSVPYMLAKAGISALCLHTNLDVAAEGGVNVCLAKAMKLKNIRMHPEAFICLGDLEEDLSTEEFAQHVKESLGCQAVEFTPSDRRIRQVAMCSGAGGDYYGTAVQMGADAFVTGEAKHHQLLEADATGVPMVAAGHFHTENVVVAPLAEKLGQQFPHVCFVPSKTGQSPSQYI